MAEKARVPTGRVSERGELAPEDPSAQAHVYFVTLFGDLLPPDTEVEVRLISQERDEIGRPVRLEQFRVRDWATLERQWSRFEGLNIYIACGLRKAGTERGDLESVAGWLFAWADQDDPSKPIPADVPPPSVVVNSGHGRHLYWLFREFVPLERAAEMKRLLWGLMSRLEADSRSAEVVRVLRLPGTVNQKDGSPVTLLSCDPSQTYGFDDLRGDYIQRTLANARERLSAEGQGNGQRRLTSYLLKESLAMPRQRQLALVNRIVYDKSITLISGPAKIGKTFWVMQLMAALATGRPFLDKFGVETPGTSLHFTAELPKDHYDERWLKHFEALYSSAQENIAFCSEKAISIHNDYEAIVELIALRKPRLVIIDPWVRYNEADENDSTEMRNALLHLDRLIERFGVSFVIVHHSKKRSPEGLQDEMDAIRGSSVLRSYPNVNILLSRINAKDENTSDQLIRMRWESNFDEERPAIHLRRGATGLFEIDWGKHRPEFGDLIVQALETVEEKALSQSQLVKTLEQTYGIGRTTAYNQLQRLTVLPPGVKTEKRKGKEWFLLDRLESAA